MATEIITKPFVYDGPGGPFEGAVSRPIEDAKSARSGIMICHAFGGQSDVDVAHAERLARLGYVGFAIDVYGKGRRATTGDEATALMGEMDADRALLLERLKAAHITMQQMEDVAADRTAAIGFCFGGKCALDAARANLGLKAVVSFHGLFDRPAWAATPPDPIDASILILHGWDDPLAKPHDVIGLTEELTLAAADWQLLAFGHTSHAFTHPRADAPADGIAYSETATQRAWGITERFLAEHLAE
jgi:dienelactone hydrolase